MQTNDAVISNNEVHGSVTSLHLGSNNRPTNQPTIQPTNQPKIHFQMAYT